MVTAAEHTAERARRFRALVDGIEEILRDESHPKHELALEWHDRLIRAEIVNPSENAYGNTVLSVAGVGHERHTRGGGQAWRDDLVLEGRVD